MDSFHIDMFPIITQNRLTHFTGETGGRICLNLDRITPQQQKGPTCGLVALSMCLEHFEVDAPVEKILETAKRMGFTKQGEMYSAAFLAAITNEFLPESATVCKFPDARTFSQAVLEGKLILIPYDCGPNYQAKNAYGVSAHWMLACGFVEKNVEAEGFRMAESVVESPEDVAIIGYQGKSTTMNVFPFSEVSASNSQLLEVGSKRNPDEYVIPDPNNLSDLRNLVVVVSK